MKNVFLICLALSTSAVAEADSCKLTSKMQAMRGISITSNKSRVLNILAESARTRFTDVQKLEVCARIGELFESQELAVQDPDKLTYLNVVYLSKAQDGVAKLRSYCNLDEASSYREFTPSNVSAISQNVSAQLDGLLSDLQALNCQ